MTLVAADAEALRVAFAGSSTGMPHVEPVTLTPHQQVAVLARAMHRIGYADHVSGHISLLEPDGTLLVTPWPYNWNEINASDIVRMDLNGRKLEGRHQINPGIPLHLALHRARPGVGVAAHNHTRYSQIWAAAHKLPPIYDQTSALTSAKTVLVDEFDGHVGDFAAAEVTVERVGDGDISILSGHGVLVVAPDVAHLFRRAYAFEWRCRIAWQVAMIGGGEPLPDAAAKRFGDWQERENFPGFWAGAVRQEVKADPTVLE